MFGMVLGNMVKKIWYNSCLAVIYFKIVFSARANHWIQVLSIEAAGHFSVIIVIVAAPALIISYFDFFALLISSYLLGLFKMTCCKRFSFLSPHSPNVLITGIKLFPNLVRLYSTLSGI